MERVKFLINEEINKLKPIVASDLQLGVLQGYFDVLNIIRRVEEDQNVVHNIYDEDVYGIGSRSHFLSQDQSMWRGIGND